jgi:hypothetical protein
MAGYLGNIPTPQATQTRDTFTATASQTSFATSGYTVGMLDVYLNGVKLSAADITATNGSDVVLASGASTGDIVEVVSFSTFDSASGAFSVDLKSDKLLNKSGDQDSGIDLSTNDVVKVNIAGSEKARWDSSGNLLVGTTATGSGALGFRWRSDLSAISSVADGGIAGYFGRRSSDGEILRFRKDDATSGSIGTAESSLYIGGSGNGSIYFNGVTDVRPWNKSSQANLDDTLDLGSSSARWDDVYATNGTIQTSDENEKQNISSFTSAEITAATAISKLFKTFKWKSKVAKKGNDARTHSGVVAQQVQTAMSDAGLDASKYAFWCSNTWWEKDVEVAAVEADEEKGIEAKDAYTRTDTYDTKDEAPKGATERTRMGVRYPELLAFIGAATEQRLTSIEARLTALEDK